ncbi:MAG: SUF system Fe-S cluster assembly regulator [Alphaproteobacteria bacterium]|nr:SUF system Fe-S cluster assembly regulator [Alphaproteobacteria bacterium]
MLRLGKLTDYAVTLLSHMGREGETAMWAASDLSKKSGLPMPTVAKVLKLLAKAQLVLAQRGATGGYKLTRAPSKITIAEIVEAMDGPIAITDCSGGSHAKCQIHRLCPMSSGWSAINEAVRDALNDVSLAQMFATPLFDDDGARIKRKP